MSEFNRPTLLREAHKLLARGREIESSLRAKTSRTRAEESQLQKVARVRWLVFTLERTDLNIDATMRIYKKYEAIDQAPDGHDYPEYHMIVVGEQGPASAEHLNL